MRRAQRTRTAWKLIRDIETNSASHLYILMIIFVLCLRWILQYFCFNPAGFLVHTSSLLVFGRLRRMERSSV